MHIHAQTTVELDRKEVLVLRGSDQHVAIATSITTSSPGEHTMLCEPEHRLDRENRRCCGPGRRLDRENVRCCGPGSRLDRESTMCCGPGRRFDRENTTLVDLGVERVLTPGTW